MEEQKNQNGQEQDINQLLKVRREKLADLQERGKDPFQITKFDVTHHSQEIKDDFDALEGKTVTIAGRMMSKRVMGKASFCNVQDLKGNIQCYVARDNVGEEEYKDFKAYVEEQGYEVFPMSAPINQGVQEVLAAAANKLQQVLAEPQEEDDYELFDFEKDENDPDYRTVTVSYDGNSFVLHGKQLLKIFNSTNFTDFGSLRYLYKYIEKSGAIDQMKEMGIEDGDIIKIEDFEFEYYDEDYFED